MVRYVLCRAEVVHPRSAAYRGFEFGQGVAFKGSCNKPRRCISVEQCLLCAVVGGGREEG